MRDWSLLGIIIGISVILGFGLLEETYLKDLSEDMKNEVIEVEDIVNLGDIELGTKKLQDLIAKWEKSEKVLEVIINHQDIHKISDTLIEIDSKLKDFSNSDNVSANFALLKEYIIYIKEGNEFTTSNML